MTYDEIKEYFGTSYRFQEKTGFSHANYYAWRKQGYVPIKMQLLLEDYTQGFLKASLHDRRRIE